MNLDSALDVARQGRLYPSVILHGRGPEARREFARAAALTRNERERALLLARTRKRA